MTPNRESQVAASPSRPRSSYTGRACDRCRGRKQRCSGQIPTCASCLQASKECHYSDVVDRRTLARSWKRENTQLRHQVAALKQALRSSSSRGPSPDSLLSPSPASPPHQDASLPDLSIAEYYAPRKTQGLDGDSSGEEEDDTADSGIEPFGTGGLVLSPDGNLHLGAEATFYRPRLYDAAEMLIHLGASMQSHIASGGGAAHQQHRNAGDAALHLPYEASGGELTEAYPRPMPPHQAPYLPIPLTASLHQHLISLFFAHTVPFGMNTFQAQFTLAMHADPTAKHLYFSPFLHLVALGIGSRYNSAGRSAGDYAASHDYVQRGEVFIERARAMADAETESPSLGTIIGLVYLSMYCFGMMKDQAATNYYAIAVFLVQEFRLHRKCDGQLHQAGFAPHGELDVARRDVYGFMLNYSSWWMNYFARLSLHFFAEANQRPPFLRRGDDGIVNVVSAAFRQHCLLSESGHRIVFCNHSWRTTFHKRFTLAKRLSADLLAWRQNLPPSLQWPQPSTAPMMLPGVAALLAMYNAYIIELHRPYINISQDPAYQLNAIELCVQATEEMIDIVRYIRDFHGAKAAPLTTQQAIHVSGTMLVLLASGLANRPEEELLRSRRNLLYLLRWLDEFAEVWPAAGQTAESLRNLEKEHCF